MNRFWVYKCNKHDTGADWVRDVFERRQPTPWGDFVQWPALKKLRPKDILLAYQTDRNEIVGLVQVHKVRHGSVVLRPTRRLSAKMRPLKERDSRIRSMPAFAQGPAWALRPISNADAGYLIRAAEVGIKDAMRRQRRKDLNAGEARLPAELTRQKGIAEVAATAAESAALSAQGFKVDPKVRKRIERYAIAQATAHYKRYYSQVNEIGKPYDLLCRNGLHFLYVEVKGTLGLGGGIFLTPNEVDFARQNEMELYVFHSIKMLRGRLVGGTEKILKPWRPTARRLKPITFLYKLG